jgi:hypothetical protein
MSEHVENLWFMRLWVQVGIRCREVEEMGWFANTVTVTIIVVAFLTGVDVDALMVRDLVGGPSLDADGLVRLFA